LGAAVAEDAPELMPDEEPELIPFDPTEPQAPNTKAHASGMIHLVIKTP